MKKEYYILLSLLLLLGCNKTFEKKTFYDNGKIKELCYSSSKKNYKDDLKYCCYFFNNDGSINEILNWNVNRAKYNTFYEYFDNGKLKSVIRYRNELKHGLQDFYSIKGKLTSQMLYIDDKPLIKMKLYNNQDVSSSYVNFFYYVSDDSLNKMGVLSYDKDYNILANKSFYFQLLGKDTITNEDKKYKLTAKAFAMAGKCKIDSILIGDFDANFDFIKPITKKIVVKDNVDSVSFYLTPDLKCDNLVLGMMYITGISENLKDTLTREFVLYHTYFVRPH